MLPGRAADKVVRVGRRGIASALVHVSASRLLLRDSAGRMRGLSLAFERYTLTNSCGAKYGAELTFRFVRAKTACKAVLAMCLPLPHHVSCTFI